MTAHPRKIIERFCSALAVTTLAQLAQFLDVVPSAINGALRKGKIPEGWLYKVAYATGRRVDWLRTGEAPEFLSAVVAETQHRYGLEDEALRLHLTRRRDLGNDQRRIIDQLMDLLLRADDETREAMLVLLTKPREPSR